ncbi:hypothetical protein DFJ73DRAFT_965439 [Zopfochytrium polystomum]|nr:hypothetical protein DFJ73DRAFT_965439 [Zopfochytrium polystomum]
MKVATVDPAVIASDIVIPPSQDIYGLFTFPFDSPMPPALDLLTSTMHPNKMQVLYELKVAASEQRGKLLSKLVSNEPASLICNLPVPLITPSIGQSLSPSLTGEGPVGTLGPVPFPWWFRLSHQYVTPGDEFIAQIVVQHPHIGTPLDMIARVEFILSEFVIHFENPAIDPFQPVRATSHVVTRVKLSKGRMNWRSKADGVSSPALAAQCPADARTIKTVIKVPPHASARRVPSVEKVDEKLKLMAFGMRENDCVNYDGRWGSVVVMHEIICIITCKTGEMTRIAEGILPIAVGPAKAGVFAAAKVQPGIGLPDYDHGKSSKAPPSPRPSHKGEGLSMPSREPSPAPPPSLALDGSASNRPTDNSPPTYQ